MGDRNNRGYWRTVLGRITVTLPTVRVRTGRVLLRRRSSSSVSPFDATAAGLVSLVEALAAEAVAPATFAAAKPTCPEVPPPLVDTFCDRSAASTALPEALTLPMPTTVPEIVPPALTLTLPCASAVTFTLWGVLMLMLPVANTTPTTGPVASSDTLPPITPDLLASMLPENPGSPLPGLVPATSRTLEPVVGVPLKEA